MTRQVDIHWIALAAFALLLIGGILLYVLGYDSAAAGLLGAAVGIALPQAVRARPAEPRLTRARARAKDGER